MQSFGDCISSKLVEIVSLLELIDTATGVNEFLLAGEIGMALGANFNSKFVALLCCACLEGVTASADNVYGMVIGMNTLFHVQFS